MRASAYLATSIDGYIARNDGGLDWLADPIGGAVGEDYGYADFMADVDALAMGRGSYETLREVEPWPHPGRRVVVLSRSLPTGSERLPSGSRSAPRRPRRWSRGWRAKA